jgi:hypothetical protein
MGQLISGINGHIRGKIGTVIGSSWKSIPYVKGPYKKRTARVGRGEAGNRSKFSMAHFWLKPLLKFVREGFRGYTETVEGFNAAKSHLLLNAFEGIAPGIRINPALAAVSFGDLPMSNDIAVAKTAAGQLEFTWDPSAVEGGHPKDQVMMLAYNVEEAIAYYTTIGQFRRDGADVLHLDPMPGRTYHIYCAFTAADRSRQSNSVYLGAMTM